MGFITKKIKIEGRIIPELIKKLQISPREAQKFMDRKRVYFEGRVFTDKKATLNSEIEILLFEPQPTGLKPIFEMKDFAIFDKPSGLAVHPKNLSNSKTLLDDIKYCFGKEANLTHRIDKETSGLIIASKNKQTERIIKKMFEEKQIQKYYKAIVKGKIDSPIVINKGISVNKNMDIKVKVLIDSNGKKAITKIIPIKYIGDNTLIIAKPLTGRQHQIRVHLDAIGHPIIGDPIYGVNYKIADKYLRGELSYEERMKFIGANRLMLHSYRVVFEYNQQKFDIFSNKDLI